ncbi:MAG TPA: hypothetical protein VK050_04275 [Flavobacteriaceae bacterium]|nr:hypothetical protein [Flavobacteriaceae bacterium]
MKRLIVYLVISFFCLLLASCSLKHKWQNNQKEKLSRKKQEHISHVLTSERIILDTSFQIGHSKLKNYRLWRLSGKVNIQANGTIQTDQAILQTWHSETDSQQTSSFKTTYQNKKVAESFIADESIDINTKSSYKEKRKLNINLWWLLLLVIPLFLWRARRRV